jgi:nucleotide-binding universal stress UspA family protein
MAGIVCAIRGGPNSRPTISRAIELSREYRQLVYFLYVVNLDFLSNALHSNVLVMEEEMRQMGEFILLNAQEMAAKAGIEAQAVTRKGQVREEIISLCREVDADYVILGRPQHDQLHNVLDMDALEAVAREVEESSGAQVVFAEGGSK